MRKRFLTFIAALMSFTAMAQNYVQMKNSTGEFWFMPSGWRTANDLAAKSYLDATFYTQAASDARYYTKAYLDTNFALKSDLPSLQSLTAGTGLSGSAYNGGTARTWTVDTTWLDARIASVAPIPRYPVFVIDTSGGYKDAELKGIEISNITDPAQYWVTTARSASNATGYATNSKADLGANVFFCSPDIALVDARRYIQLIPEVYNSIPAQAAAMSALSSGPASPAIGNIEIWPNIDGSTYGGTAISTFFNQANANYDYVTVRLTATDFERSAAGNPVYRAARPFYRYAKRGIQYILRNEQFADIANTTKWPRGLRISSVSAVTSDLPTGYTSGVQITGWRVIGEFGSAAGLLYNDFSFNSGKTYIVYMSAWLKKVSATETGRVGFGVYTSILNSTYAARGTAFSALSSTAWTKITYALVLVVPANNQKIGIMVGIQGADTLCTAQITGLTIAAIQLD